MRNERKPSVGKKILYIIFSIVMSIVLWSYVAYVENPDVSIPINNVPITFEGSDILKDNSLIVTELSTESLSFKVNGKRNSVSKINSGNVSVSVDLAEIVSSHGTTPGTYQLSYKISYPESLIGTNVSVINASDDFVSVHVEKLATVKVPVLGTFNGNVADGFTADQITFDTDEVTVSGPSDVVEKIDHAWVELNINYKLDSTVEQEAAFILLDDGGKVIQDDNLTYSRDTIVAKIKVLMVKDVALTVSISDTSNSVGNNYTIDISPKTIQISGEAEDLNKLNSISLGNIDLNSFAASYTSVLPIIIPDGMENITGDSSARVAVSILGLDTKLLTTTNITTKNAPEGMDVKITTQSVDVLLRGTSEELDVITADDVRVVASLSELTNNIGTYAVDAKIMVDGFNNIDAIGEYSITVILS